MIPRSDIGLTCARHMPVRHAPKAGNKYIRFQCFAANSVDVQESAHPGKSAQTNLGHGNFIRSDSDRGRHPITLASTPCVTTSQLPRRGLRPRDAKTSVRRCPLSLFPDDRERSAPAVFRFGARPHSTTPMRSSGRRIVNGRRILGHCFTPHVLNTSNYFQIPVIGAASRSFAVSGSSPKLSSIVRSTL